MAFAKKLRTLAVSSFFWTVVVPVVLASTYFGLLASDVYLSEARFVVRSPQRPAVSGFGAVLQSAGFSRSQDDAYSVQDFMLSRDALQELERRIGIRKAFGNDTIDRISRFAGIEWDDSFEALHRYYRTKVDIQMDSVSSIATLTVRAFSAEDAHAINQALLELGEGLVNRLNDRGRQDMIRFAADEVAQAERRAAAAATALSRYRNERGVIDPEKQSTVQLQQVAKLNEELIAAKSQLAQVNTLAANSSHKTVLENVIRMLEKEVQVATAAIVGGRSSLANKAAEFQRLSLEREFADKQLAAALSSLEQARNEAIRKQFYLERIVQPGKPDMAIEPRRIRNVLATLVLGLIAWGVLSLFLAGVREHRD